MSAEHSSKPVSRFGGSTSTDLHPSALRLITVFRVEIGITVKLGTWNNVTLTAMHQSFILTAYRYRTFAVKEMSHCFYTAAAAIRFFPLAAGAVQSTTYYWNILEIILL